MRWLLLLALGAADASKDGPFKVIAKNKQAYRNYEILETFEAGIELLGTEVKSARGGRCSIDEGYAAAKRGECVLHGVHIAPYATSNAYDQHEAKRPRRLLLHKREIKRLEDMTTRAGYTAVPLTLYFNHKNLLKISVALARGKNERDKRDDIQQREAKRDLQRAVKACLVYWRCCSSCSWRPVRVNCCTMRLSLTARPADGDGVDLFMPVGIATKDHARVRITSCASAHMLQLLDRHGTAWRSLRCREYNRVQYDRLQYNSDQCLKSFRNYTSNLLQGMVLRLLLQQQHALWLRELPY
ncbi:small protein B [Tribonema minus]|uniref:Small protein B n=1 Tax=Tribonema minus TaxID=303371 RepID=A0A835YRQ5_9STRA|nr:small protein B [Tribonema minus]